MSDTASMEALAASRPWPGADVVRHEADGEALVYVAGAEQAVTLNASALRIFELCDGGRTVAEIARELAGETGAAEAMVRDGVASTVRALHAQGLLAIDGAAGTAGPADDETDFQRDRLGFRLPDFTRLSWVSDPARGVWEPRIQRIGAAWSAIEWHSILAGLRRCALASASPNELVTLAGDLAAHGLAALPVDVHGAPAGYASSTLEPKHGQPFVYRVAMGEPGQIATLKQAMEAGDDRTIGRMLGYPDCCRVFFKHTWVDLAMVDTTWPMAAASIDGEPRARRVEISHANPIHANILWRWMGVRAVPHLPCSFECPATVQFGEQLVAVGRAAGFGDEMDWLEEILAWPVEWSALHGIAEIKTPVLKVSSRTDATAHRFTVQKRGRRYPDEGATGLHFPYRPPGKRKVLMSAAFKRGLENPIAKDKPLPDWYASDNGFSSTIAMDQAHAPIVERALASLPAAACSVIDLGCGNGALLKKICEHHGQARPFGLELEPAKVAHARELNPAFAANFAAGDLFGEPILFDAETRYSLAIVMPGRLTEVDAARAARLRALLAAHCDRILVYGYGEWLTRYGTLRGLAEQAGFVWADGKDDTPAALVTVAGETQ